MRLIGTLRWATVLGIPACLALTARASGVAGPPASPYLGYVYRFADTMIERGRDVYGVQRTGLFLSVLDRATLKPPATSMAVGAGIVVDDQGDTICRANPQLHENLLRVLYVLRGLSSQAKYSDAADHELKFFLEHAASPETGLLCWGRHAYWNATTDECNPTSPAAMHELARPWLLWPKCYELAPQASRQFAVALWEQQIADHETGAYDRQASDPRHDPKAGQDSARQGGFCIRTWAEAYAHTQDDVFLTAIETLLKRFEKRRDAKTGLLESTVDSHKLKPVLSLAIDCDGASRKVPEPLASRLRRFADREDEAFCGLPHDVKGRKGFVTSVERTTGQPGERRTPLWDAGCEDGSTAMAAMMCVSRYENTGKACFRDLITAAADAYLTSMPNHDADAWPMTFGHAISLELAAWRATAHRIYLDRARELASLAIQLFFQDNPLPRASLKTDHYDDVTGADTLALALVEVHLASLQITAVRAPDNTIDR